MDGEERKRMNDGITRYFSRIEGSLFVDSWEVQPCLWDPE